MQHTAGGERYTQLVAAYAPVESKERPNFFKKELEPIMSINSLLGIDANCVPNAIEDYRSDSGATPPNKVASELLETINSYELEDAKITTYGHDQPIYTSHHVTKVDSDDKPIEVCKTRIDQIYTPLADEMQWDYALDHDFWRASGPYPDHIAQTVTLVMEVEGKGGVI